MHPLISYVLLILPISSWRIGALSHSTNYSDFLPFPFTWFPVHFLKNLMASYYCRIVYSTILKLLDLGVICDFFFLLLCLITILKCIKRLPCIKPSTHLYIYFILVTTPQEKHYEYSHITDQDPKAQRASRQHRTQWKCVELPFKAFTLNHCFFAISSFGVLLGRTAR